MEVKDTIQAVALLGFLLFVALPLLSGAMWLLRSPNATTADAVNLIEGAAIPWWTGLAQAAPLLFVIVAGILIWAGADEVGLSSHTPILSRVAAIRLWPPSRMPTVIRSRYVPSPTQNGSSEAIICRACK